LESEANHSIISYIAEKARGTATDIAASHLPRLRYYIEIKALIVDESIARGIDLIVMGTSGRGGANKILIGSVTERVIEYSTCPVLVVK
jgi:nucleotide-binding universal stress UspA family protein